MSKHVIFVPGLGDHRSYGQNIAIQLWRLFGLKPHYLALGWGIKQGYAAKQDRLLELVDSLYDAGNTVALVGVSAGASATLNAYASSNKISKLICICGKINNPQTVHLKTFEDNPDFEKSVNLVSQSLATLSPSQIASIMSIHPWRDQTVPIADTIIIGAKERTFPGWSHVSGIFFGIILGSVSISRFINSNKDLR